MPTTRVVGVIRKGQTNRNEWSCGKVLEEPAWEEGWTNRQKDPGSSPDYSHSVPQFPHF